ncbi:hypothetical protein A5761_14945 [Mycolicibacterium setense]|uniref:hypothetical protein n=1 Tax=Mycolicibacterium setense TaxID=431269 RepID=UPI0003A8A586|nr:hypothetical protein [Mycolicibacterium setense]OBB15038.1 hypothetical protein A5761_14945 [Mycolicibacterium setense]
MPIELGTTDISKVYVGSTQASAVYLGSTKVWPSAIEFVSAASGSGTMPTHAAGDTILAFVVRADSGTLPGLASGYTSLAAQGGFSGGFSLRVASKVAESNSESGGTWTSASFIGVLVYRNVTAIGISAYELEDDASGNINFPAYTLSNTDSTSWGVRLGYSPNINAGSPAVASNVPNTQRYKTTRIVAFDSNGTMSTGINAGTFLTNAASAQRVGFTLELKQHT